MNSILSQHHGWIATREDRRNRRANVAKRAALARDLAAFQSHADLIELSAMLERYGDADTEAIRQLVDCSRAA